MSSDSNIIMVEEAREEIKQLNVNMARLKREIPAIIHEEINQAIKEIIKELRKPKPPIERGYQY